ncbi:MAG: sigma-54-dependent Fis family transcriptional regulator [Gammaproteobacteria bacterium]|nr:sigma-54-dependent Fis family transcriptional regulator [Gammaproteobacteria bacterium]
MPIDNPKILVIDDEADIRHLLAMSLVQMNIEVDCAKDVADAMKHLQSNQYNFCITDMKLPDGNGLDIVEHCHNELPQMPIAVITAFGNTDIAVKAMKLGAFDFLAKPIELVQLRQLIQNAFKYNLEQASSEESYPIEYFYGSGQAITDFKAQLKKIHKSNAPVIISGAKGTEKEKVAKYLHSLSSRADYAEVYLDCSTLNPEQVEEQIFSSSDKNILQQAHNSSLIINNIHLLEKAAQKKLLQVLETKTLTTDDGNEKHIDIRVIVCTESNLDKYVASLQLREDLFFRLDVLQLSIPCIEQRQDDFEELLQTYLESLNSEVTISQQAIRKLARYKFPYNYRELKKILVKAESLTDAAEIQLEDLDFSHVESVNTATQAQTEDKIQSRGDLSLDEYVAEIEKQEIRAALDQTRWNRTEAAKLLGISFRTIRYKIKKLDID